MQTVVYEGWYLRERAQAAQRRRARLALTARQSEAGRVRLSDRREPCPGKALAAVVAAENRGDLAGLSRMIGRHDGYLGRFIREGVPAALTPRDHQLLADHFGLDARGLGIRDLWAVEGRAA